MLFVLSNSYNVVRYFLAENADQVYNFLVKNNTHATFSPLVQYVDGWHFLTTDQISDTVYTLKAAPITILEKC